MFTTLVVPLDGTPYARTAVRPAVAIARRAGAEVQLVTVTSPGLDTLDDELALKTACSTVADVGCSWRVLQSNDVASSLARAAVDLPDAILCMATHGRSGIARTALGSTAEATVRASTRPIILVGPHAEESSQWDVVQACVDPTSPLSRRAVPVAAALARVLGARLWLTEVVPAREAVVSGDVTESGGLAALGATLRRDGVDVEWEVFHGDDAVAELLRAQQTLRSSLLVASTHARAGVARVALGSVTMRLAHEAPCPLVVVPPAPVEPAS